MPDPAALGDLLAEAGFVDVETIEYVAQFDLPAPADFLWQYISLTPMAPLVAAASQSAKAAMEAHVVNGGAPLVVEGRIPLAQPMALATARR
jgi:hypothetical protein